MAKQKSKLIAGLMSVLVLILCAFVLTACGPKSYTVKFMVQESGQWRECATEVSVEGAVELPKAPSIYGYNFVGWFEDENGNVPFDEKKVEKDTTAYARMTEVLIDVTVTNEKAEKEQLKNQKLLELDSKLKETYVNNAQDLNLVFDGWYTNEECTTPYTKESNAMKVFGRYMAKITFDNGYETVFETSIVPNGKVSQPTVNEIKKNYMDEKAMISFVDSKDNQTPFNFNSNISKNTTVRVLWQSPYLEIKPLEGTQYYTLFGFKSDADRKSLESFPVISLPGQIMVEGMDVPVQVAVVQGGNLYLANSATKIIVNEGVQYVNGLSAGPYNSQIKEVQLPNSLRILESSIKNFDKLEKVNLPEGLEVIFDCFWTGIESAITDHREHGYENVEIVVPTSVNNICCVPSNLKYADSSVFSNDGNKVYKQDSELGKVLVSDTQKSVQENGSYVVEEGVNAVQVGVFDDLTYDFMKFPSTFTKVSYNNNRDDYPYYTGSRLTTISSVNTPESDPTKDRSMRPDAYAIIDDVDDHKYIQFNASQFPEGMNKFAFIGRNYVAYDGLDKINVVFVAEVAAGEDVTITVTYDNTMTKTAPVEVTLVKQSGVILDKDAFMEEIGLTSTALGYGFNITCLQQFGIDYDFNAEIKSNQYIDIEFAFSATGVTTKENEDGTVTVTGFDKATAQALDGELTGTYLVVIPDILDDKNVSAIAAGAFENNEEISQVIIGSGIKSIGAKAFKNVQYLSRVTIGQGALEEIGEAAFEYAGCIMVDGKPVVNEQLPTISRDSGKTNYNALTIELPLSAIKTIGPRAFNSPAIREFTRVAEEKDRQVFNSGINLDKFKAEIIQDGFYYHGTASDAMIGIVKYIGGPSVVEVTVNTGEAEETFQYDVFDVELYSIAAGCCNMSGRDQLTFGQKIGGAGFGTFGAGVRYTLKSGSVALYDDHLLGEITFTLLKKVEANAFVYLNPAYTTLKEGEETLSRMNYMNPKGKYSFTPNVYVYTTKEDILGQSSEIFEEKWFMGKANAENDFMAKVSLRDGSTPGW